MSFKIDNPFHKLCTSGKKITIKDLKRISQNQQIPFFKLLSRSDIDVEILEFIYENDEFIFSNYPSDDLLMNGKEILLSNRNITLCIVKFMSTVINNIELLENLIEAEETNPSITNEMIEFVRNEKEKFIENNKYMVFKI